MRSWGCEKLGAVRSWAVSEHWVVRSWGLWKVVRESQHCVNLVVIRSLGL